MLMYLFCKTKHPSTCIKYMVNYSDKVEKIIKVLYTLLFFF